MYYLGIDIGSSSTKLIAVDEQKKIVGRSVVQLGTGTAGVQRAVTQFYASSGLERSEIARSVVTGYGRVQYADADQQVSEITCHAKGLHFLHPQVRTVIDIGGQDTKIISVNEKGIMEKFTMNDKCAAGTGRFLDVMSKVLDIPISKMGEEDARAQQVLTISNTCTVFAESEVISKLSAGCATPDIIAGIHQSVARRVAGLAFRNGVLPLVALTGGVAQNQGIIRALEQEMECKLLVPADPQVTGALGAALLALQKAKSV